MKAASFEYARPTTVAAAKLLLDNSGDSKIIAGGQTLVPLMTMRLARPRLLVDIASIPELTGIETDRYNVVIKACTRQAFVERAPTVLEHVPLLGKAIKFVGHPQNRNRGTLGGSVANADPAAEIALVALTLGAELRAESIAGERVIPIDEFFLAPMITTLSPSEILISVRFPIWRGPGIGCSFIEVSQREGDFALVSVACQIEIDQSAVCRKASVAMGGVAGTPVLCRSISQKLCGGKFGDEIIKGAMSDLDAEIDPEDELHASAEYRRRVARVLGFRAIREAWLEALANLH